MKEIPDRSVDLILTDPPFGTTACKWDSVINFGLMWEQLKRIIKPNSAIVLFGAEPFSSLLRCSNIKDFKYSWERGLVEHEIDSRILNALKEQGVYGWIQGKNMLGCCVFRTYILIPESVADIDGWNK